MGGEVYTSVSIKAVIQLSAYDRIITDIVYLVFSFCWRLGIQWSKIW